MLLTACAATLALWLGTDPSPPLRRLDGRVWEVKFEASAWSPGMRPGSQAPIALKNAALWFPLVPESAWSRADAGTVAPELWVDARRAAIGAVEVRRDLPRGTSAVRLGIGSVSGQSVKWSVTWRAQCWASQVDEAAAASATWPAEWPEDARPWLAPEPGIESDAPDVAAFVARASEGKLRAVTPWIAAKELARATVNHFNAVDTDGIRIESGFPRGIVFDGAQAAMSRRTGTCHDVAAACTAVLRAAGIPARMVLGVSEVQTSSGASKARFVSWCEFFLPGAGWAPFSPLRLRASARGGLQLQRPWPSFGTWDELNGFIPLCFGVGVAAPGASLPRYPAGYAWTGGGRVETWQATEAVTVQILSRGRAPTP